MSEILNAISGWLSLVALIFAIPLGIAANLVTPKFQSWLASRSNMALQQRISSLETLVQQTDRLVTETPYAIAEFVTKGVTALIGWVLALAVFVFFSMMALGVLIVSALVSALLSRQPDLIRILFDPAPSPVTELMFILGFLAGAGTFLVTRPTFVLLRMAHRVTGYKKWKDQTLTEIQKLKARLQQKNQS